MRLFAVVHLTHLASNTSAAATVGLDQLDHPQARIGSELLASHAHAALRLRFFDASLRVRPNSNPKVQDADGMLPRDPTIPFGMCFVKICTSLDKVLHCTRLTGVATILHTSSPSCVRRQMYWNRSAINNIRPRPTCQYCKLASDRAMLIALSSFDAARFCCQSFATLANRSAKKVCMVAVFQ